MRSASLVLIFVQAFVWLLIAAFGFNTSAVSSVVAATQLPGLFVLERLGWCCGNGGGFVIADLVTNRWGGLTLAGAPVLAATNTVVLAPLFLVLGAVYSSPVRRA